MDPIIPQPPRILLAVPLPAPMPPESPVRALWRQDRIARLTALTPEDAAAGLLWLAMNFPPVCDAMLDKIECDAIDDPDPGQEPEPFCAECGADVGIFLRYGLDWRHYRGDPMTISQIELFDPGHQPAVAWRRTHVPATR